MSEPPSLINHFRVGSDDYEPTFYIENLRYLIWTAGLRQKFFDAIRASGKEDDLAMPIIKVEFASRHSMHEYDKVALHCHVTRIGTKSFDLSYELWNTEEDILCAYGKSVHVAVNRHTDKSREIPKDFVEFMRRPPLYTQTELDELKETPLMRGIHLSEENLFPEIPTDGFQIVGRKVIEPFNIDGHHHVNSRFPILWSAAMSRRFYQKIISGKTNAQRDILVNKVEFTYERPLLEFHGPEEQPERETALVGCRAASIDMDSIGLAFEVWSTSQQRRCAHGMLSLGAHDPFSRKRTNIPEDWRSAIRAHTRVIPITDAPFIVLGSDTTDIAPRADIDLESSTPHDAVRLKDAYTGFFDTARHLKLVAEDISNNESFQTKYIRSAHTHLKTIAEHDPDLDPQVLLTAQRALVDLECVAAQDPGDDQKMNVSIADVMHKVDLIAAMMRQRLNLQIDEGPARKSPQIRKSS
ncbi:MAG TPA: thioesterase family protein [Candidatus Baltobacteraceae bacterium]|jgi:acyl-CoA thioesterase FadM|nr:thioesterase family protein [Candidatus Baltobacteraceae bacterium]